MSLIDTIKKRKAIRAFTQENVDYDLVSNIIDIARHCPTGGNMQPWRVSIVVEKSKRALSKALLEAFDNNIIPDPDYDYYPTENFSPFFLRRHQAGTALYQAEGIEFNEKKADWQGVNELIRRNYNFFGANIVLIFYMDHRLTHGAHMDVGMFMQNIMLLAQHFNLGTCPQASVANYPNIVREQLKLGDNMRILCGMGIGYADTTASINQASISKEEASSFTVWHK